MTDQELIQALKCVCVETGSLACFGCGYEHSCGLHGCAILKLGVERLVALQTENAELRTALTSLKAELVKAQDEGRVHIDPPPAKEGDPKPSCFYLGGGTIWCLGLAPDEVDEPCDRCKACWYCESGDYADDRAEAEAKLDEKKL